MGFAFQPVRGNWETKLLNTASAATFGKGALVAFDTARNLQEATVGSEKLIGIALHRSVDSFPAGKVLVAIPLDGTAVASAAIETDVVSSLISIGQCYTFEKSGNTQRVDVDSQASAYFEIVGPLQNGGMDTALISSTSQVEVVFLTNVRAIPSAASLLVPAP